MRAATELNSVTNVCDKIDMNCDGKLPLAMSEL